MELGVMANCFSDKSCEDACKAAKNAGLSAIEPGSGGFAGKVHCDPAALLNNQDAVRKFEETAEKNELRITALACAGNPLHPDKQISHEHTKDLEASIELASTTGVRVINCFAGCPGAGKDAKYPNWITCP